MFDDSEDCFKMSGVQMQTRFLCHKWGKVPSNGVRYGDFNPIIPHLNPKSFSFNISRSPTICSVISHHTPSMHVGNGKPCCFVFPSWCQRGQRTAARFADAINPVLDKLRELKVDEMIRINWDSKGFVNIDKENWLVGFGTFCIFPYIGNNHPNWLIFFRGVETTNLKINEHDIR